MKHLAIAVLPTLMCVPTWAEEIFIGTPIARIELAGEQVQRTMLNEFKQLTDTLVDGLPEKPSSPPTAATNNVLSFSPPR